jgi:hypothetical protein
MARPQPGPARSGGGKSTYVVGLCSILGTAILSGGLVVEVAHSPWVPLIVGVAAVAAISVLASIPAALLGAVVVLATPCGRRWLGEHLATALARRHDERMAAASPEQPVSQHLHVSPEMVPLNGGRRQS